MDYELYVDDRWTLRGPRPVVEGAAALYRAFGRTTRIIECGRPAMMQKPHLRSGPPRTHAEANGQEAPPPPGARPDGFAEVLTELGGTERDNSYGWWDGRTPGVNGSTD